MNTRKKILAISGSTRKESVNLNLINAIRFISEDKFEINIYKGLADLPQFNPDNDNENVSEKVTEFRNQIRQSDGVLICTPEYAMGLPGSLKNALDWTVSSCEFSHKPVVAITASTLGQKAHESLIGTLKIIETKITDDLQLLISYAQTKIDKNNQIKDEKTLNDVKKLIEIFFEILK